MQKLTRKQIREGLDQVPIETLLVGSNVAKEKALTSKQKEFARQLALGESKAGAYRKAYKSQGKPATQSRKGQELAKRDAIQAQREAFERAIELERLRTPAMLRALVISRLTDKATDPEVKDAQQIKALELLGKVTEVAAFGPERREVLTLSASVDIRAQLLESLKTAAKDAAKANALDLNTIDAESLLAELSQATDHTLAENQENENPPTAHPPSHEQTRATPLLSNPHIGSSDLSEPENPQAPASNASDGDKLVPDLSP